MSNQIILVPVKLDKTEVQNSSANVVYLPFASSTNPGVIKINDLQFTIDDGVLSLHYASGEQAGIIKINEGDFTIDGDGILSLKDVSILQSGTEFHKALSVIAREHQIAIEEILVDLDTHYLDETAHNIPAQIDAKIFIHNTDTENSHISMRTNVATNISDIATINDTTIPAIDTRVTAVENSKITVAERDKLLNIEETAQVNVIEKIIVNAVVQTITSKSIDLTTDIKDMIDTKINALIGEAPELLDTLKEIAKSLNNDPDFYNTITSMINEKLDTDFSTFTNQAVVKNTDVLAINDGATVKKITVENLLAEVYVALDTKINNFDLINELPEDLVYGGENIELVEPVVTVYNAERLDGKLENALDVNSAVYDSEGNIIKDTYRKHTDTITNATNADKILFDGSYVSIGSTSVNYSTNSGTAETADKLNNKEEATLSVGDSAKLGGKEEATLSVASAVNATTNINGKAITSIFETDGTTVKEATNSGKLNNKLEANLSVADSVKLNGFVDTDFVKKPEILFEGTKFVKPFEYGDGDTVDNPTSSVELSDSVVCGDLLKITFSRIIENEVSGMVEFIFTYVPITRIGGLIPPISSQWVFGKIGNISDGVEIPYKTKIYQSLSIGLSFIVSSEIPKVLFSSTNLENIGLLYQSDDPISYSVPDSILRLKKIERLIKTGEGD